MGAPILLIHQTARGRAESDWAFQWWVREVANVPTLVNWMQIEHPSFAVPRLERRWALPGAIKAVVSATGHADDVLNGVEMLIGIEWQGEDWLARVPLVVRFDRNGHPDTEPGAPKLEKLPSKDEQARQRVLKIFDQLGTDRGSAYLNASEIAPLVNSTTEDVDYQLEVLEGEGYVELARAMGGNHGAMLTTAGRRFLREGIRSKPPSSNVSIGAIIQSMTGGNVQAVGAARDAKISQVVNDPQMMREMVADLGAKLIEAVKTELPARDLSKYVQAVEALTEELQRPKPDASAVKRLLSVLAFSGDVEGNLALMARVWPYVSPLVVAAGTMFGPV